MENFEITDLIVFDDVVQSNSCETGVDSNSNCTDCDTCASDGDYCSGVYD